MHINQQPVHNQQQQHCRFEEISLPSGIVVQLLADLDIDFVSHLPLCDTTTQNRLQNLGVRHVPWPRPITHDRLDLFKALECVFV